MPRFFSANNLIALYPPGTIGLKAQRSYVWERNGKQIHFPCPDCGTVMSVDYRGTFVITPKIAYGGCCVCGECRAHVIVSFEDCKGYRESKLIGVPGITLVDDKPCVECGFQTMARLCYRLYIDHAHINHCPACMAGSGREFTPPLGERS